MNILMEAFKRLNENNKTTELNSIANQINDLSKKIKNLDYRYNWEYGINHECYELFLDTNPKYVALKTKLDDLNKKIKEIRSQFEEEWESVTYDDSGHKDYETRSEIVNYKLAKLLEPELDSLYKECENVRKEMDVYENEARQKYKQYLADEKAKSSYNADAQTLSDLKNNKSKLYKEICDEEKLTPILDRLSKVFDIERDSVQFEEINDSLIASITVNKIIRGDDLEEDHFDWMDDRMFEESRAEDLAEKFGDDVFVTARHITRDESSDWEPYEIFKSGYKGWLPVDNGEYGVDGDLHLYCILELEKPINDLNEE